MERRITRIMSMKGTACPEITLSAVLVCRAAEASESAVAEEAKRMAAGRKAIGRRRRSIGRKVGWRGGVGGGDLKRYGK